MRRYEYYKFVTRNMVPDFDTNHGGLFSIKTPLDNPKFDISTERPKADAYRIRLRVYELRHLPNGEIGQKVQGIFEGQETHEMHSRVGRHLIAAKAHLENVCSGVFP